MLSRRTPNGMALNIAVQTGARQAQGSSCGLQFPRGTLQVSLWIGILWVLLVPPEAQAKVGDVFSESVFAYTVRAEDTNTMTGTVSVKGIGQPSGLLSITNSVTSAGIAYVITSVEGWGFAGCTGITQVVMSDTVTSIEGCAFIACYSLTNVTVPASVTNIGESAFSQSYSLTSIVIPEGVDVIRGWTFLNCSGLTNVVIPESVHAILGQAFQGCNGLPTMMIPNNITNIADYAFYGCSGLKQLVMGSNVTTLGEQVFEGCSGLTNVVLPERVISVGYGLFTGCRSLANITVCPNNPAFTDLDGVLFDKTKTRLVTFPNGRFGEYLVPESVTAIGMMSF